MRIRLWTTACGWVIASMVAFAQATMPGARVRVLGVTMARQVTTRVDPTYPAAALQQGVSGEVVLYAAVSKEGSVEEVAVVDGPKALQSAAMDAVKQWKFRPWMVDGVPSDVATTVVVDFKRAVPGALGLALPSSSSSGAMRVGTLAASPDLRHPRAAAPTGQAASVPAKVRAAGSGAIDWEADRHAVLVPAKTTSKPSSMLSASLPIAQPMAGSGSSSEAKSNFAKIASTETPGNGANKLPVLNAASSSSVGMSAGSETGRALSTREIPSNKMGTLPAAPLTQPLKGPTGTVLRGRAINTEWHLLKKVAPDYPADAVEQGIEGVVLVSGVVKTDGRLRDLQAVSGPTALRQAAIDAAAQYVYEPVEHGDDLTEARTQVPVMFTLSGPAKVAPEVMAGRILNAYTPPYPPGAVQAGVSGEVTLHVVIGRQGQVKEVRVVSGREMLRATAVDAVKQWQYLPYKRNGVDVDVETDVIVRFSIVDR